MEISTRLWQARCLDIASHVCNHWLLKHGSAYRVSTNSFLGNRPRARGHASLQNRPVALAVHTPRALVREVSHEAFNEGIEPGMPVELARRICPGLRLVPPDSSRVRTAHRELQRMIMPLAPVWESIHPGSLFLDLTGTTRLFGPPIDQAAHIGRELTSQLGWNSVIGLAGSKLVSQLAAATLERPPQVLSIHPGSEQPFLAPLPATLLPGLHRAQDFASFAAA